MPDTLYAETAARLRRAIALGTYPVGSRLPSVRALAQEWGVAINTAISAYRLLESEGAVSALARSGFVVRAPPAPAAAPQPRTPARIEAPVPVGIGDLLVRTMRQGTLPGLVPLGIALPHPDLLPGRALLRRLAQVQRDDPAACLAYDVVPGRPELRRAIARRLLAAGATVDPEAVLVTGGAQEALHIALRAVCPPGSCVAIESPAYPGMIHAIGSLGLTALEVPAPAATGMAPEALEQALDGHQVAAVLCSSTFSNPGGCCMPPAARRALVELCRERQVPLIDDDTYGDLAHDAGRPPLCLGHDRDGLVLHVGSFSKSVAPGLRLGFLVAGRWARQAATLKVSASIATAVAPQLAVARLLDGGEFDRHRLRACPRLGRNVAQVAAAVRAAFPEGTRVSQPAGGFVLWIEVPRGCDVARLYADAERSGVGFAPGTLFSPRGRFRRHLRLTAGWWDQRIAAAVAQLGRLAAHQLRAGGSSG